MSGRIVVRCERCAEVAQDFDAAELSQDWLLWGYPDTPATEGHSCPPGTAMPKGPFFRMFGA